MKHPNELQYTKSHEWIKTEDGVTLVGISDFAQDALGDVVFINLPAEGDQVTAGEAFGGERFDQSGDRCGLRGQ